MGVIMYLSPIDQETFFPPGMGEVAMLDSYNNIVFLHIFYELVEHHREQLLVGEKDA
jgi:hypothetical protein